MKKNSLIANMLLALLFPVLVYAGTVTLQWDACPVSSRIIGYNVYMDGKKVADVTTPTADIPVTNGAHTFYVTAYNIWGESAPSNTVTTPALAGSPLNIKYSVTLTISSP